MRKFLRSCATTRIFSILLLGAAALVAIFFLPTLFHSESALQIRASRQGISLPDGFYVYQRLNAEGIHIKSITPDNNALLIKFDSVEQSNAAEKVLHELLPYGFSIGRPDAPGTIEWMHRLSQNKQAVG